MPLDVNSLKPPSLTRYRFTLSSSCCCCEHDHRDEDTAPDEEEEEAADTYCLHAEIVLDTLEILDGGA